jgi:nucleoside-diphosphate-sugar epimerase
MTMKLLVTGGGGFLGQAICAKLVERGHEVVSFSRSRHAGLDALRVKQVQGDLASLDHVAEALRDVDAVFHVAAKAGAWGSYTDYFDANVRGTENVIAACHLNGVRTLVHTSTPSVAHRGTVAVEGGNEQTAPVASSFKAWYPATKAVAEKRVLEANGPQLATVALRPRLIWGPGDNHLLPRLAERAHQGRLRFVGDGLNRIDTTYIDNAAQAHIDAFDALHEKPGAACAGKAYFISNGEPKSIADMVNSLLRAANAPTVTQLMPFRAAYWIGAAMEVGYGLLPGKGEPPMTRFLAEQLSTPHWYDISAAKRDFGYQPKVSIIEGLRQLSLWWKQRPAS